MDGASTISCTARQDELTDEQWAIVAPFIPNLTHRPSRGGRPLRNPREALSGILWVLRHSARWHDLPDCFPSYQTCHRRFQQWMREATLRLVLEALEKDLRVRGGLDVTEWLINYMSAHTETAGDEQNGTNEAEACGSWQQQTAMLFLSRSTLILLHRLRSPLARKLSHRYFPISGPSAWASLALLSVCRLAQVSAEVSGFETTMR